MKHLKIFEEFKPFQQGDYVLMDGDGALFGYSSRECEEFADFINSNIGVITNINNFHGNITVKYENVPKNLSKFFINYERTLRSSSRKGNIHYIFTFNRIKEFARTEEELKIKIEGDKFNL